MPRELIFFGLGVTAVSTALLIHQLATGKRDGKETLRQFGIGCLLSILFIIVTLALVLIPAYQKLMSVKNP